MFTSIHHVSLSVSSLYRSLEFYKLLGFKEEVVRPNVSSDYFRKVIGYPEGIVNTALMLSPDKLRLELMEYVHPKGQVLDLATPNVGSTHLCLLVDDMDHVVRQLKRSGVVFKSESVEIDAGPNRGGKAVYFLDPDGYTMELLQQPS